MIAINIKEMRREKPSNKKKIHMLPIIGHLNLLFPEEKVFFLKT